MLKGSPSIVGVLLAVFALMMGGTIFWSLVPRKIPFETNGIPIELSRETRLRAEIEALANALNKKYPPRSILFPLRTRQSSSAGESHMLLGLPLLQLLTVSQFRAILAHEFGHYYAGDTRMGPWVFRASMNMAQVTHAPWPEFGGARVPQPVGCSGDLRLVILGGLSLWWKLFNRITQHVSRKQEYRCDELACYLAGSESLEKGLCSVSRAAATFAPYWNQIVMTRSRQRIPAGSRRRIGRFLHTPEIAKAASAALEKQLAMNSPARWIRIRL